MSCFDGYSVHIDEIPLTATKKDLVELISSIVHSTPFTTYYERIHPGETMMNFDIHILPQFEVYSSKIHAILTFPDQFITTEFLAKYDSENNWYPLTCNGINLKISKAKASRHTESTLKRIQLTPWLKGEFTEQYLPTELKYNRILLKTLQFGRFCWDQTFSIEHQVQHPKLFMIIDDGLKELRITDIESQTDIIIPYQDIVENIVDWSTNTILISSRYNCKYEVSNKVFEVSEILNKLLPEKKVTRKQGLNTIHEFKSGYISHSIRLEFQNQTDLKNVLKTFKDIWIISPIYKKLECHSLDLYSKHYLKIIYKWFGTLPIEIGFQLQLLMNNWILTPIELIIIKKQVKKIIKSFKLNECVDILKNLVKNLKSGLKFGFNDCDRDTELLTCFDFSIKEFNNRRVQLKEFQEHTKVNYDCYHVIMTPSHMYLTGPFVDQTNRVIRMFFNHQNRFLKVSFLEENHFALNTDRGHLPGKERISIILKNGFNLMNRHYDFLGYSNSALRSYSVIFVTPFTDDNGDIITASVIRDRLGDFSNEIFYPARYGARLSQAFTSTYQSITIEKQVLKEIPDIEYRGSVFTDGVGVMSKSLAKKVWNCLKNDDQPTNQAIEKTNLKYPSGFQFRLGGLKGMLTVDSTMEGTQLLWRRSMSKFLAPHLLDFEVAKAFTKPSTCYLNRPLIKILEDLGVSPQAILSVQNDAIKDIQNSTKSFASASKLLEHYGLGKSFKIPALLSNMLTILDLDLADICEEDGLPSILDILRYSVYHILRDIKHRARIPVPGSYVLGGVADEWKILKAGEIYACVYDPVTGTKKYLEGPVCISRSPTLHPGDVQIVHAIGRLPNSINSGIKNVKNLVVFSVDTSSKRSLPSCLGGGDLDGDEYVLLTNPELLPKRCVSPYNYPSAPKLNLGRPCNVLDIADFVVNYFESNILGLICSKHLTLADIRENGTMDPDCIHLAGLASLAVDFPKSGTPVPIKELHKVTIVSKPDFMAPEGVFGKNAQNPGKFYPSQKVLGQLFRAVNLPSVRDIEIYGEQRKKRKIELVGSHSALNSELVKELPNMDIECYHSKEHPDVIDFETNPKSMLLTMDSQETLLEEPIVLAYSNVDILDQFGDSFDKISKSILRLELGITFEYPLDDISIQIGESFLQTFLCSVEILQHAYTFEVDDIPLTDTEILVGTIIQETSQVRHRSEFIKDMQEQSDQVYQRIRQFLFKQDIINNLKMGWILWIYLTEHDLVHGIQVIKYTVLELFLELIQQRIINNESLK
ncbi:RNA dependent RNA polymerase-domain-containing protein [Globomyces pollinis-pini]|nr:RNA dependent RNA polymerase-domain-containing protein [Globomyces pollinis-pini]